MARKRSISLQIGEETVELALSVSRACVTGLVSTKRIPHLPFSTGDPSWPLHQRHLVTTFTHLHTLVHLSSRPPNFSFFPRQQQTSLLFSPLLFYCCWSAAGALFDTKFHRGDFLNGGWESKKWENGIPLMSPQRQSLINREDWTLQIRGADWEGIKN